MTILLFLFFAATMRCAEREDAVISGLELTGLRIEGNLAGKIEMKMEMVGEETIRNGITVASVPWSNRSGLHIQINIYRVCVLILPFSWGR